MSKYDASAIRWLKDDIDKVQGNHNYYVGANGSIGVRQMPIEVFGNSMDEGASGHGDTIIIRVDADGTCTVWDFGRGIPVGEHPEHPGHNVLTILCTTLHSGGKKSDQSGYAEGTVGTHGLGMTVVNALSHSMTVWSNNQPRTTYMQRFERGKPVTGVVATRDYPAPPHVRDRPGTVVQFRTDLSWFGRGAALDWDSLIGWIKEASWFSYCNRTVRGRTERTPMRFICIGPDGKAGQIKRAGLHTYFDARLTEMAAEPVVFTEAFHVQTPNMDVVLGWSSDDGDHVAGYVNAVRSALGGTHTEALLKVVDTVFRRYAKPSQRYKVADLLAGAVGCINIRIKEPHFDSQSKTRLTSPVLPLVQEQLQPVLERWAKQNAAGVREVIDRACSLFELGSQLKTDRRIAAALKVKTKGKILLPEKALVSHTKNPAERELFVVEGDSAKGGCDTASDRRFQEILPLRGKLPNLMRPEKKKKKGDDAINSTIVDILKMTGITPADGTSKMRVGRIMILTDADPDGSHIAALLCGLLLFYAPTLFDEGKVWFVDTPLFAHQSRTGVKTYARSYAALSQLLGPRLNAEGSTLTRAKGLGELNPDVLEDVVFNPATRRLIQITSEVARGKVKAIMGVDGTLRKEMVNEREGGMVAADS